MQLRCALKRCLLRPAAAGLRRAKESLKCCLLRSRGDLRRARERDGKKKTGQRHSITPRFPHHHHKDRRRPPDVLKDERNDALHALLISRILLRELLEHELFFVAQFYPEAHEYERRSDNSGDMPQHDDGRNKHGQ